MRSPTLLLLSAVLALAVAAPARATDVDGPNDCTRNARDFGDAPELVLAYPGVPGLFPTCTGGGPGGTQNLACPPISTFPGPSGFVMHDIFPGGYWLGCPLPGFPPMGVDTETDGKTNNGGGPSACSGAPTDCVEAAFGLTFGQDECYGDNDAGIAAPVNFIPCASSTVRFTTYNCSGSRQVVLNILVDWNRDGDWNDNFQCVGSCAYEWAVKNVAIVLPPGCATITSPAFTAGPNPGEGWMRITISDGMVPDAFPWEGSRAIGSLRNGETEDYPVTIGSQNPCDQAYRDYGDAPEQLAAYPSGAAGNFPTCTFPGGVGTQQIVCPPISTPPGPAGFIRHVAVAADVQHFWLGCAVDDEADGKVNGAAFPGTSSICNTAVLTDCVESAFGGASTFGQDECYGDADAALASPIAFTACSTYTVRFTARNCTNADVQVYLNILVDWNEDGDWNDNFRCISPAAGCAYEWAVKNVPLALVPGCVAYNAPAFLAGPQSGNGWMRITLTQEPVPDDYPWNGSAGSVLQEYRNGETEDYPVTIHEPTGPCDLGYEDFGDAPEEISAYPSGVIGHFPTCLFATGPGTMEAVCPPLGTPPGPTGVVRHAALAGTPDHFWLGCAVDGEIDGKVNLAAGAGTPSVCNGSVLTDCVETAFGGMTFGQDECYGDADAGVAASVSFTACATRQVTFTAYNCATGPRTVFLNILVDWNEDGDWNDNFQCPSPTFTCVHEWAVKNVTMTLEPGCASYTSPVISAGPRPGFGWMRITVTEEPVPDDFPWNGSAGTPLGSFRNGETEDYPVVIATPPDPCHIGYQDFGDAPENLVAYPSGIVGRFPTCLAGTPPGTQEILCAAPLSTPPATTGFVRHSSGIVDPTRFWLGCGIVSPGGIDGETDGKVNLGGGAGSPSFCSTAVTVDCAEAAFGGAMVFGQDECTADGVDAGLGGPPDLPRCDISRVGFRAYNCGTAPIDVYLNVLVDWNQDGDWNDNVACPGTVGCAFEWAIKNKIITLPPGCSGQTSPDFRVGPREGPSWMRITVSFDPAPDDFPWNGSVGTPIGSLRGGETEDYPVEIRPSLIGVDPGAAPQGLWLGPVVPNPTRDEAMLHLGLPREAEVRLGVYDITGRQVRMVFQGTLPAGEHRFPWNFRDAMGAELPTGVYLVKLQAAGRVVTRTTIRIR